MPSKTSKLVEYASLVDLVLCAGFGLAALYFISIGRDHDALICALSALFSGLCASFKPLDMGHRAVSKWLIKKRSHYVG